MAQGENLSQVLKLRDKIVEGLLGHIGTSPEGAEYEKFVDDLMQLLPDGMNYGVVQESVKNVLGKELTKSALVGTAWRLAGNIDKLKKGETVYPWQAQTDNEWVPIQVISAVRAAGLRNEAGYLYKMIVLSGSPASVTIWKTWTTRVCAYVARQIGFSAPWKDRPYRDGHELVGMRLLAELDPALSRDGKPSFENVACNNSIERWNKDILKARAHIDPPCPYDFKHFCFQCPIGYDKCKAGTHPSTYIVKACAVCAKETWHDPAVAVCVACRDSVKRVNNDTSAIF